MELTDINMTQLLTLYFTHFLQVLLPFFCHFSIFFHVYVFIILSLMDSYCHGHDESPESRGGIKTCVNTPAVF